MAKQLTIRGVSEMVAQKLESLSRARGQSVNATVLEILSSAFEENARRRRLARYVTWTEEERQEFERNLAAQRAT